MVQKIYKLISSIAWFSKLAVLVDINLAIYCAVGKPCGLATRKIKRKLKKIGGDFKFQIAVV